MEAIVGAAAIGVNLLLLITIVLLAAIYVRLWRNPAPPDGPPPAANGPRPALRTFSRKPAEKRRPFAITDERAAELEREEAERPRGS